MKHSEKILQHDSFTYRVIDYNAKTKEYTLVNPASGHVKIMPKEDFDRLYKEQKKIGRAGQ